MKNLKNIIEAIIFSAGDSISYDDILEYIPGLRLETLKGIIEELKEKYSGDNGILLLTFGEKMQFSSNPKYGTLISEILTPVKERTLSKSLLEVLSIIAYRQPVTRHDIEDIRGVSSEYAINALLKMNMIFVSGRKNSIGRPSLFSTTDEFLKKFELQTIDNLPDFEEIKERIAVIDESYNSATDSLYYREEEIANNLDENILPEHLQGEKINIVES